MLNILLAAATLAAPLPKLTVSGENMPDPAG